MKTNIVLFILVGILGTTNFLLAREVDELKALKARVDWVDKFLSKQDVEVRTGIYELNVLSDKIINTILAQDKRLTELEKKK